VPIAAPRYRLISILAAGAPEQPGVYALWHDEEMIYLGRAASIRRRLAEHLQRSDAPCLLEATHYTWELALRPEAREAELLAEFRSRYGRLPRCNGKAA
jgi:excinuclease UvrABC nuclease subunit